MIPRQRLGPPSVLDPTECAVWTMIVNASSAEHFWQSVIPLMVSYCQTYVQLQRTAEQLKSESLTVPMALGVKQNPMSRFTEACRGRSQTSPCD